MPGWREPRYGRGMAWRKTRLGGLAAVGWGLLDWLATRIGVAAGIFTDFPGFSAWIAEKLGRALSAVSLDAAIVAFGAGLLAWSLLGDRIRERLGRARPGGADEAAPGGLGVAAPAPAGPDTAALASRLGTLEARLAGGASGASGGGRADAARLEDLSRRLGELDRLLYPDGRGLLSPTALDRLAARIGELSERTDGQNSPAELRSDTETLRGEVAAAREGVKALRFWMAEMSRVQMDATRIVAVRRLMAEAPPAPDGGEGAGAEAMRLFAHVTDRYASMVESAARHWGLTETMDFPGTRAHAERAVEAELRAADAGLRLSAAEHETLRGYRIALRQSASVAAYLVRQVRLVEGKQEEGLNNLISYYERERPKITNV